MNAIQYVVFIGSAINLVGTWLYLKDVIRGDTKPNRVSFIMWSIAPFIGAFAAIFDGVGWAVLPVFMTGLGPLIIFLFLFLNKNAYWKLELFDYVCGIFSLLALVLWWATNEPLIAIVFAIISDGFASLPTLIKSWKYPETETGTAYALSALSSFSSFFAVKFWNFSEIAFPIYLVAANMLIFLAVYRKKIKF